MNAIYQKNILLKTKIDIPTPENILVKRIRLIDKLEQSKNLKVILITAPAGYGKTALLSSWAAYSTKTHKVTWLMLDKEDNDEELFWSYFMLSFYNNLWVPLEMRQRAELMLHHQILFSRRLLIQFINDLMEVGIQTVMVLDDFDIIKNEKIIIDLEFLIRHLPSNVHLIISGREYSEIGLAKYKASGNLRVITGEELAFTQEETISFFRNKTQKNLLPDEYININHVLEGWVLGMQFMAVTADNLKNLAIPIITKNCSIYTYLMDEVICRLDIATKDFLIETAALDWFCPDLCDYLFHTDNTRKSILRLQHLNLFLTSVDEKEGCFRYHKLFREFLQILMQEENKHTHMSVYEKASKWCESKKYWNEAIGYAVKGHHFDRAVRLIEEVSGEIGRKGESLLLHKWNQSLPREIVEHNLRLLLNSAWAYSSEGNTAKLYESMNMLRKFKKIPVQQQLEITALYSTNIAGPQADLDEILAECRQALALLAPQDFLMQLLLFNIGSTLLLKGSVNECLSYFEQCYMKSMTAKNFYLAVISKKAIITSYIRNGWLERSELELRQFLDILSGFGEETLPVCGLLYAQLAEIHYQMKELKKAQDMALEGIRCGAYGEDIWATGENYLILGKIYQAMNEKEQYKAVFKKIMMYRNENIFFDLGIKSECYHIQTLLSEGKLSLASRHISRMEKAIKPELSLVYSEYTFLKARFYMNKGNLKKAEEMLVPLKKAARINGQEGLLCEVLVLCAALYKKMGRELQALKELETAVILAGTQGNIQFFLNEGEVMKEMLKRLQEKRNPLITNSIFVDTLLCCFETLPEVCDLSGELLSNREAQILDMVSLGAGNEEIAESLFISKNTVKTHLLNIYTKLDVHSRTMAVSKAKALKIIPSGGCVR